MNEILDRADVARILADPRYLVPEAEAAAVTSFDGFRARVSRFVNGTVHDERRARLEELLCTLDPRVLAGDATAQTRRILVIGAAPVPGDTGVGADRSAGIRVGGRAGTTIAAAIAQHVPAATLARGLGFRDPDEAPALVARIAARYPTGRQADAGDAAASESAIERLRAASAAQGGEADLHVQLLVQAHAATGALVIGALRRLAASGEPGTTTPDLLHQTLRDEAPVPATRRIAPDGAAIVLRLDGPDREAADAYEARVLAFGDGPRRCPAPHHALAIAGAIVDELRRSTHPETRGAAHADHT